MDDGGGLYIIWTQLRAYAVPIFVYLAGFTGCTGSLARLKHGKCGGKDVYKRQKPESPAPCHR